MLTFHHQHSSHKETDVVVEANLFTVILFKLLTAIRNYSVTQCGIFVVRIKYKHNLFNSVSNKFTVKIMLRRSGYFESSGLK